MESSNYKIDYSAFSAGGVIGTSDKYGISSSLGEFAAGDMESMNYGIGVGEAFGIMANVPNAPTIKNNGSYYSLDFTIDNADNPIDCLFGVAISPDDWTTTYYVQSDKTIGTKLNAEDWQTFAA